MDSNILKVIREIEEFRFKIHCDVYSFCVEKLKKKKHERTLYHNQRLVSLGFPPIIDSRFTLKAHHETGQTKTTFEQFTDVRDEDEFRRNQISALHDRIQSCDDDAERVRTTLDPLRSMGLEVYLDLQMYAFQLDMDIRRLLSESTLSGFLGGRWDVVFLKVTEAVRSVILRNAINPLWPVLEEKRWNTTDDRFLVYQSSFALHSDHEIIEILVVLSDYLLQNHMNTICSHYRLTCRYLENELNNIANFMIKSMPLTFKAKLGLHSLCKKGVELCEFLWSFHMDKNGDFRRNIHMINGVIVKLYRECLSDQQLADEWLELRFPDSAYDEDKTCNLLFRTADFIKSSPPTRGSRVKLNGWCEGVVRDYMFPVPKSIYFDQFIQRKPWWVERFRPETQGDEEQGDEEQGEEVKEPVAEFDSLASTVEPPDPSSEERRFHNLPAEQKEDLLRHQAQEINAQSAQFCRDNDHISDLEISSIPFCTVNVHIEDPLKIKWTDNLGVDEERSMNVRVNGKYHCRYFQYDPDTDKWMGQDMFCRFKELLPVKQKGGFREPVRVEDGSFLSGEPAVFKFYRDKGEHRIDTYMADVRAQAVAGYYVRGFQDQTEDKFGRLRMMHSDLVLVFRDGSRSSIIDYCTRERYITPPDQSPPDFFKLTNNWTYKNSDVNMELFEAYSHFTYHASEGVLLVADLQGFPGTSPTLELEFWLTDPVIHCRATRPSLFGRTNYGTEGMREFFHKIHPKCNHICQYLYLKRPNIEQEF